MRPGPRVFQRQLQDEIRRRGVSDLEYIAIVEEKNLFVRQLAQGNTAQVLKQISTKKQLLAEPADKDGNLPLHIAALNGRDDLIVKLIELGADPNARNHSGETPVLTILTKSVLMDSIVLYETLIRSGAKLSLKDNAGRSVVSSYLQIEPELIKMKSNFVDKLRPLLLKASQDEVWAQNKVLIYGHHFVFSLRIPLGLFRDILLEYW